MEFDIKSYVSHAKELEVAIYKQKRLMNEHRNLLLGKRPLKPIEPSVYVPSSSNIKMPLKEDVTETVIIFVVFSIIFFFVAIWLHVIFEIFFLGSLACAGFAVWLYVSSKKEYKKASKIRLYINIYI